MAGKWGEQAVSLTGLSIRTRISELLAVLQPFQLGVRFVYCLPRTFCLR